MSDQQGGVRPLHMALAGITALLALGFGGFSWWNGRPEAYQPEVGQAGKDVIWVPTPAGLATAMLEMADVGPDDVVVDLGSGDGRIAIAAAKEFGATARGLEFNTDMVALSRRNAEAAGVGARATFAQADIFASDFSDASVVTMYLLPDLNLKLRPILLGMRPGTRIVSHAFDMGEWLPDEEVTADGARAFLWIVPAKVDGVWEFDLGPGAAEITFVQVFQAIEARGALDGRAIGVKEPRLKGDQVSFMIEDPKRGRLDVRGAVSGDVFTGEVYPPGGPPRSATGRRRPAPRQSLPH